ncbi:MAG: hypothetical protein U0792_17890 [Gemmataceae bacterium]
MPVQRLNKTIRDEIFQRTLAAVRAEQLHLASNCLEFAWHGSQIIKEFAGASRTIIQAGSASWPRLAIDDGVSPTHFSYEWNAADPNTRLFASGHIPVVSRTDGHLQASLPEMHVWLACPDSGEIIDFTTGLWPQACRETLGEAWNALLPPDYLWTFVSRLPDGVRYIPDRDAIDLAIAILRLQDREYP